jgi:hypothetical protein
LGTREILYVQEGALTLIVEGRGHVIEAGGAAAFAGDRRHSYANEDAVSCRFVLTVCGPVTVAAEPLPAPALPTTPLKPRGRQPDAR